MAIRRQQNCLIPYESVKLDGVYDATKRTLGSNFMVDMREGIPYVVKFTCAPIRDINAEDKMRFAITYEESDTLVTKYLRFREAEENCDYETAANLYNEIFNALQTRLYSIQQKNKCAQR